MRSFLKILFVATITAGTLLIAVAHAQTCPPDCPKPSQPPVVEPAEPPPGV